MQIQTESEVLAVITETSFSQGCVASYSHPPANKKGQEAKTTLKINIITLQNYMTEQKSMYRGQKPVNWCKDLTLLKGNHTK